MVLEEVNRLQTILVAVTAVFEENGGTGLCKRKRKT
jgi:hypothetical protein